MPLAFTPTAGRDRAALLILLLVSRRYRESLESALLLAAAGVVYGAVDLLTWGDWFHSARVYLLFNLRGGANDWGVMPFTSTLNTWLDCPGSGESP